VGCCNLSIFIFGTDAVTQTLQTPKAGTSSAVRTWLARSTTRRTRPTSRRFTAMAVTPPFGVRLVFFTSKSTNFVTLLMHTRVPSASTLISLRSGLTWAAYTRAATTKSQTPSTLMLVPANLTLETMSFRSVSSSSKMLKRLVVSYLLHQVLRTCIQPLMPVPSFLLQDSPVLLSCYNRRHLVPQSSGLSQTAHLAVTIFICLLLHLLPPPDHHLVRSEVVLHRL
jgi:hypothetical protein